ncbi:MAG: cell division protein ZapA [Myxococcota bacterium]
MTTATSSPKKKSPEAVNVEIRGQKLSVKSDHDPEFVRRLASHIDEKVAAIQQNAPTVPLSKLLMLASMTVAEELFEARNELDQLRGSVEERADAMMSLLDQIEVAEDAIAE